MRILIHGINFSPELTGIGKYTGEMAVWLAAHGHDIRVVTAPPYYPQWLISEGFANGWCKERVQVQNVSVNSRSASKQFVESSSTDIVIYRCPIWVPKNPSGLKRILHLASFFLSSFPVMLRQVLWKPDVVWVVEPALFCAPSSLLVAKLCGAKSWLHVQDFEVDAAFDMGLLRSSWSRKFALWVERTLMFGFDRVSTISSKMLAGLAKKGIKNAALFQNWVDINLIFFMPTSRYREELNIVSGTVVALYSGNMGEKQGLEVVIEAARLLEKDESILFVLCGDGAAKRRLHTLASNLSNVIWIPLQPLEQLNELLNLADIHLLPQRSDVADLVMPSKLTGMLASSRPVITNAQVATEAAAVVNQCGLLVEPGNSDRFAAAIKMLAQDRNLRMKLGDAGRKYAEKNWAREVVLERFVNSMSELVG